ncbi:hypothetical protein QBC47DRAFT_351904 [Echria macrotheca]|uniref:BTB domain-containing protein n=1 Tax=Echria macrotheca TaxID=438768 RepID=A0AAJ0B4J3_9PEZI|nr:hypothetical protein QBC47DRAFT_351904 [Echria macrotheca]
MDSSNMASATRSRRRERSLDALEESTPRKRTKAAVIQDPSVAVDTPQSQHSPAGPTGPAATPTRNRPAVLVAPDNIMDPDGDVLLMLTNPNGPVPSLYHAPDVYQSEEPETQPIPFKVSSRHLILASPMFKAALTGGWMEGGVGEETKTIEASDWNVEAFRTVMNVVHGRSHLVPRSIPFNQLYRIALVVDYYQLHDAMNFVGKSWVDSMRDDVPALRVIAMSETSKKWLAISWVFRDPDIFKKITSAYMLHGKAIQPPKGVPIPSSVIAKMNAKRSSVARMIVETIQRWMDCFLDDEWGCHAQCRAIYVGQLSQILHDLKADRQPTDWFEYKDFHSLMEMFQRIEPLKLDCIHTKGKPIEKDYFAIHKCSSFDVVGDGADKLADDISARLRGLKLQDFLDKPKSKKQEIRPPV